MKKWKTCAMALGLLSLLVGLEARADEDPSCLGSCVHDCLLDGGRGASCVPLCRADCRPDPTTPPNCSGLFPWKATEIYVKGDEFVFNGSRWVVNTQINNTSPDYCPSCKYYTNLGACPAPPEPPFGSCVGASASPYQEGATYRLGDVVERLENRFSCKVPGWCSQAGAGWAYAPATGAYWPMAWDLLPFEAQAPASTCMSECMEGCGGEGAPRCITQVAACRAQCRTGCGEAGQPPCPPDPPSNFKRVAYYPSYASYVRDFHVNDIDAKGIAKDLTHLIYAFEGIVFDAASGEYHCSITDPTRDLAPGEDSFTKLKDLKAKFPNLKTLVSIGGFTLSDLFEEAAKPDKRVAFVKSCVDMFITSRPGVFDGIDIDWEFPTQRHCSDEKGALDPICAGSRNVDIPVAGDCADTQNFTELLREFRKQLGPSRPLAIAVGNTRTHLRFYDFEAIHPLVDFIDVFGYDNWGAFSDGPTAHQAALHRGRGAPRDSNVEDSIGRLGVVVPLEKLIVGIPMYARGVQWTSAAPTASSTSDGLDSAVIKGALPGTFTKPDGKFDGNFEKERAARGIFDQADRAFGHVSDTGVHGEDRMVVTCQASGRWPSSGVEDYSDLAHDRTYLSAFHDPDNPGVAWFFGTGKTRNETNAQRDGVCPGFVLPLDGPVRTQFWSLDDKTSIQAKMAWIREHKLGGAFIFDLSQDYRVPRKESDPRDHELTHAVLDALK